MSNREHWITRGIVVAAFALSQLIDQFNVPGWLAEHQDVLAQVADICSQLVGANG